MSGANRDNRRIAAEAEDAGTEGPFDDRLFSTLEEADSALKRSEFEQGFGAVRRGSSNKGGPEKTYRHITYACAKGIGRASTATKYKTSTRKVGCLWAATISSTKRDQWKWTIRIKNGAHNHDPVDEPSSLAPLRKLTDPMKKLIRSLRDNPGSTCRTIYNTLKAKYPLAIFIIKDVENYIQRLRRESLKKRLKDDKITRGSPASTGPFGRQAQRTLTAPGQHPSVTQQVFPTSSVTVDDTVAPVTATRHASTASTPAAQGAAPAAGRTVIEVSDELKSDDMRLVFESIAVAKEELL